MEEQESPEAFYARLKTELENTSEWPNKYLFKFILKTDQPKIQKIESYFDNLGAVIDTRVSKKGNYTSVSVNVIMEDADKVIEKYKLVASLGEVILL
jgi:putative lipoic acid-binding regulatory protein